MDSIALNYTDRLAGTARSRIKGVDSDGNEIFGFILAGIDIDSELKTCTYAIRYLERITTTYDRIIKRCSNSSINNLYLDYIRPLFFSRITR